jgi:hypothetical protein
MDRRLSHVCHDDIAQEAVHEPKPDGISTPIGLGIRLSSNSNSDGSGCFMTKVYDSNFDGPDTEELYTAGDVNMDPDPMSIVLSVQNYRGEEDDKKDTMAINLCQSCCQNPVDMNKDVYSYLGSRESVCDDCLLDDVNHALRAAGIVNSLLFSLL